MALRLALTLADRRWRIDGATLSLALESATAQGAFDAIPRLLRGAGEGGGGAPVGALRAALVAAAGAQAWGAAEAIIQVCACVSGVGSLRVSTCTIYVDTCWE